MSVQDTQSADHTSFEAIRAYEWAADQAFQTGLQSILSSSSSPEQAATLTLRAKCFFYSRKSGTQIDYEVFNSWLAQQEPIKSAPTGAGPEPVPLPTAVAPSHQRKQSASILGHQSIDTASPIISSENVPNRAPSPTPPQTRMSSASVSEKVDASYPTSFAHIVELITTGQPIPGIREIPNVLNTAPPSEATRPKRQKPWESAAEISGGNVAKQETTETVGGSAQTSS